MDNEVIVITGSSNKFGPEIEALAEEMIKGGETVIIDTHFHNLKESRGRKQFMRMILDADKLIVYNKDGYIGFHTCLEITMAMEAGIPIEFYFDEEGSKFLLFLESMYNEKRTDLMRRWG